MFGISPQAGAVLIGIFSIIVLVIKDALKAVDRTVQVLAAIIVLVLIYILCVMKVPYQPRSFIRLSQPTLTLLDLTIVGGTVGGYISFAGGHRLLAGGASGQKDIKYVNEGALTGIGLASVVRVMLFLAGLAVVTAGYKLDPANPAASIFKSAAGNFGYKFFGLVLIAAGLSSVLGSTFTSVSFLDYAVSKKGNAKFDQFRSWITIGFIVFATRSSISSVSQPRSWLWLGL